MEGCCGIFCLIVFVYIVYQIVKSENAKNEECERQINSLKNNLSDHKKKFQNQEESITNTVKNLFALNSSYYGDYESTCNSLDNLVHGMQSTISLMKQDNAKLVHLREKESHKMLISQTEMKLNVQVNGIVNGFKSFSQKVNALPASRMLDEKQYGKVNKEFWDDVNGMQRTIVETYISKCEKLLGGSLVEKIFEIDINEVLKCVWFFAVEKTFSASDFQRAKVLFSRIYRQSHADIIIADLYAKKKMAGEDALRDVVRDLLKEETDSHKLTLVASGLMWMNAYQSENIVLQHMLTTGKEMNAKTQERLHSLSNGGGNAPIGFDVKSFNNKMYFDVSALAWRDDEYIGFFENLVFQDKRLEYSLAIRDENKELFIPQGINIPERSDILRKINDTLVEEYDTSATAQAVDCIALSGSGEEKMDCIWVSSTECKQMGILIHVAKIGKKLIIKFYTLFMPTDLDLMNQKQQALSMYKKLSPSVTMWESSLKDTMLMAIEQLLNIGVMPGCVQDNDLNANIVGNDEPIF